MSKHDSISDFLVAHGWIISSDAKGLYFFKDGREIRPEALVGYNVETFATEARKRGWVHAAVDSRECGEYDVLNVMKTGESMSRIRCFMRAPRQEFKVYDSPIGPSPMEANLLFEKVFGLSMETLAQKAHKGVLPPRMTKAQWDALSTPDSALAWQSRLTSGLEVTVNGVLYQRVETEPGRGQYRLSGKTITWGAPPLLNPRWDCDEGVPVEVVKVFGDE